MILLLKPVARLTCPATASISVKGASSATIRSSSAGSTTAANERSAASANSCAILYIEVQLVRNVRRFVTVILLKRRWGTAIASTMPILPQHPNIDFTALLQNREGCAMASGHDITRTEWIPRLHPVRFVIVDEVLRLQIERHPAAQPVTNVRHVRQIRRRRPFDDIGVQFLRLAATHCLEKVRHVRKRVVAVAWEDFAALSRFVIVAEINLKPVLIDCHVSLVAVE